MPVGTEILSEGKVNQDIAFKNIISRCSINHDLQVKLHLLHVAHILHQYNRDGPRNPEYPIAEIALEFMKLCHSTSTKVSKSRWIDVTVQFMRQSRFDAQENALMDPSSESFRFPSFGDFGEERIPFYELVLWIDEHLDEEFSSIGFDEIPYDVQTSPGRKSAFHAAQEGREKYPLNQFKETVMLFLLDLMTTLDQPVLMQLERGKLGNLSRMETELLLQRVGIR